MEDEIKLARFIELELSSEGYHVSVAHDGIAGLTLARDSSPDLAILDWMLPGLTGLEICRGLRATGITVPVILLTAKDEVSDAYGKPLTLLLCETLRERRYRFANASTRCRFRCGSR